MKRLYLGGISAVKREKNGDTKVKFRSTLRLQADNIDDAESILLIDCHEQFPDEEGWYDHEVSIAEVSNDLLSSIKEYVNGRKDL